VKLPDHELYILACHTAVQPDSRVSRYRKLWSSLESAALKVVGEDLGEWAVRDGDGVRWFGGRRLQGADVDDAIAILEHERSSLLVATPRDNEPLLVEMGTRGWPRSTWHPEADTLLALSRDAGVPMWLFGEFDDMWGGLAAVGSPVLLRRLGDGMSA